MLTIPQRGVHAEAAFRLNHRDDEIIIQIKGEKSRSETLSSPSLYFIRLAFIEQFTLRGVDVGVLPSRMHIYVVSRRRNSVMTNVVLLRSNSFLVF